MSGICGLWSSSGAISSEQLAPAMAALQRRGPDRSNSRDIQDCALGHTLLATTAEAAAENLPLVDAASGCAITADARLDNREELLRLLMPREAGRTPGDAELILRAYLAWGDACATRLLGDFAFAIHDSRRRRLFCARDPFGVRPFYYHTAGDLFAFASEADALAALEPVPARLNEARIGDFLVEPLEGLDLSSTFYRDIFRLPPAHCLRVDAAGSVLQRYWEPAAGPELHLASDDDYAGAFLEVFAQAVSCRLRGHRGVGVLMSGGIDSTAVASVAARELSRQGCGPLATFSAVAANGQACVESLAIRLAQTMPGLQAHTLDERELQRLAPGMVDALAQAGEPFDGHMTLVHACYRLAREQGVRAVLDGVPGDNVLSEGGFLARQLRAGHWRLAYREARLQNEFWRGAYPHWPELLRAARSAFTPEIAKRGGLRLLEGSRARRLARRAVSRQSIRADFAARIDLPARLSRLAGGPRVPVYRPLGEMTAASLGHPWLVTGIERYGRVAAALGLEPRHPWLDRRLVEFCLRLPGEQLLAGGWPKAILRRAMAGHLPGELRYRRGKEHLGARFSAALLQAAGPELQRALTPAVLERLDRYVDLQAQQAVPGADRGGLSPDLTCLALWLAQRRFEG